MYLNRPSFLCQIMNSILHWTFALSKVSISNDKISMRKYIVNLKVRITTFECPTQTVMTKFTTITYLWDNDALGFFETCCSKSFLCVLKNSQSSRNIFCLSFNADWNTKNNAMKYSSVLFECTCTSKQHCL